MLVLLRAAIEYEKKGYAENYEQGQVMEKNLITMAREVEKLRAEVANAEKRARAAAAAGNQGIKTLNLFLCFIYERVFLHIVHSSFLHIVFSYEYTFRNWSHLSFSFFPPCRICSCSCSLWWELWKS